MGVALDVVLTVTMVMFFKESKTAGSLLVPYLAWSLFATALNAKIACDNQTVARQTEISS